MTPPVAVTPEALVRIADLAVAAGQAAMAHYHPGIEVELKGDRTPITAADRAAHAVIAGALASWDPSVPVVSEEGDIPGDAERAAWGRFWLVDPLDGTKEFLSHNGEFTVNIALIEGRAPVLGAVYAPALDELYYAGRGMGSWRRAGGGGTMRIVSHPPLPGHALRVVESRSHPSAELERFLRTELVAERIPVGSSLKFCRVAEGKADCYPRFGPTMEWDVAAGDCIFRYSSASLKPAFWHTSLIVPKIRRVRLYRSGPARITTSRAL